MVWTVLLWVSELLTFSVHMFLGLCGLFDLCVMYLGECVQPDRVCVCVCHNFNHNFNRKKISNNSTEIKAFFLGNFFSIPYPLYKRRATEINVTEKFRSFSVDIKILSLCRMSLWPFFFFYLFLFSVWLTQKSVTIYVTQFIALTTNYPNNRNQKVLTFPLFHFMSFHIHI